MNGRGGVWVRVILVRKYLLPNATNFKQLVLEIFIYMFCFFFFVVLFFLPRPEKTLSLGLFS